MDELDKKLEDILCFEMCCYWSEVDGEQHPQIEKIKQAFKDAGYIPYLPYSEVPDDQKPPQPDWWTRTPLVMTGEEFYARFRKELEVNPVPMVSGDWDKDCANWIEKCAKKAAGI